MKPEKRRRKSAGVVSITLIVTAFIGVMAVQICRLKQKDEAYAARERELLQESEEELRRSLELDEFEDTVGSLDYIESVARSKLGLTKDTENEIIFKERNDK